MQLEMDNKLFCSCTAEAPGSLSDSLALISITIIHREIHVKLQRTLVKMTVFVTKDFAVQSNLLL